MARTSIQARQMVPLPEYSQQPGITLEPIPCWQPPKGLDYNTALNRMGREFSPQITNLWLDRGVIRSRYGTKDIGTGIADLMAVLNFINSEGVAQLLRFTTTLMQLWDGASWNTLASIFTGSTSDKFTFTAYNNNLIFSNGIDGMYEYDFDTGTVTKIDGAPACRQVTTFDGRVLASNVVDPLTGSRLASRVVWSVKNNSKIWPDTTDDPLDTPEEAAQKKLGSGFEDMLSTPGGQIDQQRGIWPVTDTTALAVRSRSVWQLVVTGNFDAPFRFDRLYDNLGSDAPYSIDTVPGGIIGLFNDDIYVMSQQDIRPIGSLIKDQVLAETTVLNDCAGMFDPATKQYWLTNQSFVYRYSFTDQGWSRHQYPFGIRSVMHTKSSVTGLAIDQLPGDIDSLPGAIDSLIGTGVTIGNFFATTTGFVVQEDATQMDDTNGVGGRAAAPIEIQTTSIQYGVSLQRNRTLQAQIEYEAENPQTLIAEYSLDKTTWLAYSSLEVAPTTGPVIAPFRHTIDARQFQLRIRSTGLGRIKIIGLWMFGQRGALVNL